jgi:hypothetical protein
VTAALATAALAASLPSGGSGTISAYVPGAVGAASTQPKYEGPVAFNTSGTARLKKPLIWVECFQGGAPVYGALGSTSEVFRLGGDMSHWVLNGGGAANCTAELYYILNAKRTGEWNGSGAQGGDVVLAQTTFDAAG